MREKYESLSAVVLRELAKSRGLRGLSGLRKEQLIERMLEEDEKDKMKEAASAEEAMKKEAAPENTEAPAPAVQPAEETHAPQEENRRPEAKVYRTRNYESRYGENRSNDGRSSDNRNSDNRGSESRGSDNRSNDNRSNDYRNRDDNNGGLRRQNRTYQSGSRITTYNNNRQTEYQTRNSSDYSSSRSDYRSQDNNRGQDYNSRNSEYNYRNNDYASRSQEYTPRTADYRSNDYQGTKVSDYSSRSNDYQQKNNDYQNRNNDYQNRNNDYSRSQDPAGEERMAEMQAADAELSTVKEDLANLDSGIIASGILEVMNDGFGFIRSANYMPGESDVYVSPSQIRRFNLKTGDVISGSTRVKTEREKFSALLYVNSVNGYHPVEAQKRPSFDKMTPIFPCERIHLERQGGSVAMRVVDVVSPIGKGQRGMIVSQPKAGKTTLLKEIAKSVIANNPEMHVIILLIDERPEEVTDIREAIEGDNVEVIYSTFDELPEHHKRVSEMTIERAKRLVEHKQDVVILLDSITRLARAYNLTVPPSGRTLSGGLDPAALHMPKRFFGAARKMREGGSLTILATALVDTGSKMDDVVFEEFKGTGNMELVLDRKLSEKRIFPAIDIIKSGTRREDLLLDADEQIAVDNMRRAFNGLRAEEAVENILNIFAHTKTNREFIAEVKKNRIL